MLNTKSATTREELAEQFPHTSRPYAVWYNTGKCYADPAADNRKWVVNGEDGLPHGEFEDMATALEIAADIGSVWEKEARKQAQALAKIMGKPEAPAIQNHFYDLRALAMAASATTLDIDPDHDELNAIRRVLKCLSDKAVDFANEADVFLIGLSKSEREAHHG